MWILGVNGIAVQVICENKWAYTCDYVEHPWCYSYLVDGYDKSNEAVAQPIGYSQYSLSFLMSDGTVEQYYDDEPNWSGLYLPYSPDNFSRGWLSSSPTYTHRYFYLRRSNGITITYKEFVPEYTDLPVHPNPSTTGYPHLFLPIKIEDRHGHYIELHYDNCVYDTTYGVINGWNELNQGRPQFTMLVTSWGPKVWYTTSQILFQAKPYPPNDPVCVAEIVHYPALGGDPDLYNWHSHINWISEYPDASGERRTTFEYDEYSRDFRYYPHDYLPDDTCYSFTARRLRKIHYPQGGCAEYSHVSSQNDYFRQSADGLDHPEFTTEFVTMGREPYLSNIVDTQKVWISEGGSSPEKTTVYSYTWQGFDSDNRLSYEYRYFTNILTEGCTGGMPPGEGYSLVRRDSLVYQMIPAYVPYDQWSLRPLDHSSWVTRLVEKHIGSPQPSPHWSMTTEHVYDHDESTHPGYYEGTFLDTLTIVRKNGHSHSTRRQFDEYGNLLIEVDPLGISKTWNYLTHDDPQDRYLVDKPCTARVFPYNAVDTIETIYKYYWFDTIPPVDWPHWFMYLFSEERKKDDGTYAVTSYPEYDSDGNPLKVVDPNGNATGYGYYPERLRYWSWKDEISENGILLRTDRVFESGDLVEFEDPNSNVTSYEYDRLHRILNMTRPGGDTVPSIKYSYNDASNSTSAKITTLRSIGDSTVVIHDYDGLNRLVKTKRVGNDSADSTLYSYNWMGLKASVTDPNGHTTYYQYDELGKLMKIFHPDYLEGAPEERSYSTDTLNYGYSAQGVPTTVNLDFVDVVSSLDANQHKRVHKYDANGNLRAVEEYLEWSSAGWVLYSTAYCDYNSLGELTAVLDGNGRVSSYSYDVLGRLRDAHDIDRGHTEYVYDDNGNVIFKRDENRRNDGEFGWIYYRYDALNRLKEEGLLKYIDDFPSFDLDVWSFQPEVQYLFDTHDPGAWFLISLSDCEDAYVTSPDICDPDAHYEDHNYGIGLYLWCGHDEKVDCEDRRYALNAYWRVYIKFDLTWASGVDPDSILWAKLKLRCIPDTDSMHIVDPDSFLLHRVEGDWEETQITFSDQPAFDEQVVVTPEEVGENCFVWDITSIVKSWLKGEEPNYGVVIKATNQVEEYATEETFQYSVFLSGDYSPVARPRLDICPGRSFPDPLGTNDYDSPLGHLTMMNDESGITSYYYDERGRVEEKRHYSYGLSNDTFEVQYAYDWQDNLISMIYPDEHEIRYAYNNLGQVDSVINGDGSLRYAKYWYSPGDLINYIYYHDPYLPYCMYQYDSRSRIEQIDVVGLPDVHRYYAYDNVGNRTAVIENNQYGDTLVEYSYDERNRLTYEHYPQPEWQATYGYDSVGNRISMNGEIYTYYSGTNKLETAPGEWSGQYDHDGNLSVRTNGDNTCDLSYNWRNQLTEVKPQSSTPGDWYSTSFQYDGHGSRAKKIVKTRDDAVVPKIYETAQYLPSGCDLDWILDVERDYVEIRFGVKEKGIKQQQYRRFYIALHAPEGKELIDFPEPITKNVKSDCLLYVNSDTSFGYYDSTGYQHHCPTEMQVTVFADGDSLTGDIILPLEAIGSCEKGKITMIGEGNGGVFEPLAPWGGWQIVTTNKYYIYDESGGVLCEMDGSGAVTAKYIYANGKHLAKVTDDGTYFYHLDPMGSPLAITDESGNVVKDYEYYAFGETRQSSGSFHNTHKFTGKELDVNTELHYFGARYYDAELGRFITPDPIPRVPTERYSKNPQRLNPYVYCLNNPLARIDPDGLTDININIQRTTETNLSTIGAFTIQGTNTSGATLELPWRNNRRFVSRIAAGDYEAEVWNSPGLGRTVLRLRNVEGRSDILLHWGQDVRNTEGCPLVGARSGQDRLYDDPAPPATERRIMDYVMRVIQQDRARTEQNPWLPEETSIIIHISDPPAQERENPQEEDLP